MSWVASGTASIFRFCIWIFLQVRSSKNLKSLSLQGFLSLFPLGQVKNLLYIDFAKLSKVGSIPSSALETLPKELYMAYDFGEMVMSESSLSMKWLGVSQV